MVPQTSRTERKAWTFKHWMAEYALGIYRVYGKFARQTVLCAGEADLRMETAIGSLLCAWA